MVVGVGLDICEISRMERNLRDNRFISRYFTETEADYILSRGVSAAQTMAGMFAAREALGKAIGGGIDFDLKEAEVLHDRNGRPFFSLSGNLSERTAGDRFFLSITHDGGIAAAVCVREKDIV